MSVTTVILNTELGKVKDHFSAQLSAQREQIDKRFEQVDKRFEQVDKRFEQVDQRVAALQHTVGNVSAMFRNSNAVASWDEIQPILISDPSGSVHQEPYKPEDFPNKVVKFWRLTDARNCLSLLLTDRW